MSAGRWMTVHDAFLRLVELEGVPAVAFPTLCQLIHTLQVQAIRRSRDDTYYFPEEKDDRSTRFVVTHEIWNILTVELKAGTLKIDYEFGYIHDQHAVFIGGKDYDPFVLDEWDFIVKSADVERAVADRPDSAVDVVRSAKGGAPLKYDWAAAGAIAAFLIVEDDYPADRADLERHIRAWFRGKGGEPDKRDIKQFVATMYQEKQKLEESRKTKFPELSAPRR